LTLSPVILGFLKKANVALGPPFPKEGKRNAITMKPKSLEPSREM
jgi:hypothetical protein